MDEQVVGIDLGTTNSLVGSIVGGKLVLFSDSEGRDLLPSAVGMDEADRLIVGRAARNRRLLDPEATVLSIKRRMGEDVRVRVGRRELSPPEVSALILGKLLDWTEAKTGTRPTRAVITVPAYFGESQRQATRDAGEIAGLRVERLVNEPTAAALTYQTGGEERVLVYDFGGGTFDVSVLERDAGFLEVRASRGDTHLGGDDIDRALVDHLLARLGDKRDAVAKDPRAMVRLLDVAERAKIALSSRQVVEVVEPYLAGQGAHAVHLDGTLSQDELAEIARPFVERSLAAVRAALQDAKLKGSDLDRVLLVGGTSKLRIVSEMVSELLDRPAFAALDADRAVGLGASLLAGRAAGVDVAEVLVDITPHTIAVGAVDDEFPFGGDAGLRAVPVIPRDSVVPVERIRTLYTMVDDQKRIAAPIVQGEGARVGDNVKLGMIELSDLPPSEAGSPFDLRLRLDLSGILHISASHRPSGKTATAVIAHSPYRLSEQRRELSRQNMIALRASTDDDPVSAPSARVDEADRRLAAALLARAERALSDASGDASGDAEVRARVDQRRDALAAALEAGVALDEAIESLTDALLDL